MHGYSMVLCNSDAEVAREAAYLKALKSRQTDGVVLASAGAVHDYLALLVRQGFQSCWSIASYPICNCQRS
jgi:DNA-binding LacI/PurR family transcriptional regulator